MISVPKSQPATIAFEQKVLSVAEARIAAEQLTKAARSEVDALSALDNASFRLTKATENLKAAEIAYFSAVEKSASNREALRLAYNNALAGFRDADKAVAKATKELALAQEALVSLHSLAKGAITSGDDLKAAIKAAKTDEDKAACVAAAEKLKLDFFLPKGWAAQYKNVSKREVSDTERQDLAEKGKAMPDGSYPIATVADLKNAISSYGRAQNPDAVKAHIIAQAKALNATDQLPEAWSDNTTKSIQKDGNMKAILVLCPACLGQDEDNCNNCDDNGMVPESNLIAGLSNQPYDDGDDMEMGKSFTTASLLTRDFQKSASYQSYIFTKGGPGSGPEVGHEFRGNQWTGGMKTFRDGRKEGWKQTLSRYQKSIQPSIDKGNQLMKEGRELQAQGKHAEAAEKFKEASKKAYEKAAGAHMGIRAILQAQADHPDVQNGSRMPAGLMSPSEHYAEADRIRTELKSGAEYQAGLSDRRAAMGAA